MDYSLAALKLLCGQLKDARGTPSQNSLTLGGILFQRVWLQGVLVSNDDEDRLLLDDSTGIVELNLSGDFRQRQWKTGMYVMVVGGYFVRTDDIPVIKFLKRGKEQCNRQLLGFDSKILKFGVRVRAIEQIEFKYLQVHKIVDLSPFPDREAMWYLEVLEAYELFYQPLIEEFI